MSEKYLHRDDAPFDDKVWEIIDNTIVSAAKNQLSGRKLLHIEGPYGLGVTAVPEGDAAIHGKTVAKGVSLSVGYSKPLVLIQNQFSLSIRDIASFEKIGLPFNLKEAANAAIGCVRQEDSLVFNGLKEPELEGLTTAKGTISLKLSSWDSIGKAAEDIIHAVTQLDDGGFHGPYSLALAPKIFNLLFRRYPQGNTTEIEHLKTAITGGIVKAPALSGGGVLMASGSQYASIVVGQDLMTGFCWTIWQ